MVTIRMLALLGLVLATTTAKAGLWDGLFDHPAHINSMSYSTQAIYGFDVINVYSSDGQEWDTLGGPPVKFSAEMAVDTRFPGYVEQMGVYNGQCFDAGCLNLPVIDFNMIMARNMHWNRVYQIAMDDIPLSSDTGIATTPLGDEILQQCNNHLTPNGATSLFTFTRDFPTSFAVDTNVAMTVPLSSTGSDDPDETRQAAFQVQVRCNPYISQDWHFIPPAPPVEDIELFLATFSNAITHPDAFRTCQQGRILIRVTTGHEGPVALRLWTTTGAGLEDELISTWSAEVGSGVYQAEFERWVSVSETSQLQAMAQVENGGVAGMSSGWELLPLECVTGTNDLTGGESPFDVPARGGDGGLISP